MFLTTNKQKLIHLSYKNKAPLISEANGLKGLMSENILDKPPSSYALPTSPAMAWPNPYAASLTPVKFQVG
jgi:hypothetical protein